MLTIIFTGNREEAKWPKWSSSLLLPSWTEVEFSRTDFEVLGLEAPSPRKLACSRLEDSSSFWIVKILWSGWKIFWKTIFCGDRLKNFCEDLFFFEIAWKIFVKTFFFGGGSTCACVLGPWPWPRAFLSLASRVSVLGKAVLGLGLGFFCVLGLGLEPCVLDSTSGKYDFIINMVSNHASMILLTTVKH